MTWFMKTTFGQFLFLLRSWQVQVLQNHSSLTRKVRMSLPGELLKSPNVYGHALSIFQKVSKLSPSIRSPWICTPSIYVVFCSKKKRVLQYWLQERSKLLNILVQKLHRKPKNKTKINKLLITDHQSLTT